jgi:hypothetical protein
VRLYIDLDTQALVSGLGTRSPVSAVSFKRGDSSRIEVQFFRGVTPVQLADGATGKFAIKEAGKYDSDPIVFADEWTLEGAEASAIYVFSPNFNTVELNALLNSGDEDEDNDVKSLACMAEIKWIVAGAINSTQTITANIANDVIKGTEGTPIELPTPLDWLAENGIVYDPQIDGLTGGTSTDLDGIVTVGVETGRMQAVALNGDNLAIYRLIDSTVPGDSLPDVVMPDDWDIAENGRRWLLVSRWISPVNTADVVDGGGVARISGVQELVAWNADQEKYQIIRISGAAGFEVPYIANLP